jgi:glyoxylase-like metal-dependent hydrolase (beta-lactamase superfamily II)
MEIPFSTLTGLALQQGLQRLCPTGVNLPGLSTRDSAILDRIREGGTPPAAASALAVSSLVQCLQGHGFVPGPALENVPGVRLFREPLVPLDRLSFPGFGGVDLTTKAGSVHFVGNMWSNKDIILARAAGRPVPRFHVLEGASAQVGRMGAEFVRNNFFVTGQVPTFIVENEEEGRLLSEFLRKTYESTETEALGAFPSPRFDELHKIVWYDDRGEVTLEEGTRLQRRGPHAYRLFEGEEDVGTLNLKSFAAAEVRSPIRSHAGSKKAERVRRAAIEEKKAGVWPIGTANGFATREETSGFMVWNRGRFVLVDPPSSTLEYLEAHRIPLELLEGIVITHGHTDHCTDAVPRILERRPKTRLYTTRRIFDDLSLQLDLALGKASSRLDFKYRAFVEVRPRTNLKVNGMTFRFHETLHSLPALGFEIWNKKDLVLHFSGDTFADPAVFEQFQPGRKVYMTHERAFEVLRHYFLIPQRASQKVPPIFLIEAGVPPLHTAPDLTRAFLDFLTKHLGVDTSRVLAYHISDEKARAAKLRKWLAGHEGWIDLSDYYE